MAEYIDREALLAELIEEIDFETAMYTAEQNKYFNMGLRCAYKDVKHFPAADVEEVKHGRWIRAAAYKDGVINTAYCSVCKVLLPIGEWEYDPPYCRHCGAKMNGGKGNG